MARTKAVLGAVARLSDFLSASLLARVYPPDLVHQVLDVNGDQKARKYDGGHLTFPDSVHVTN